MPWVMAALTAAQMLQGAQNAEAKRQTDAAGIRYSPWTRIAELPSTPDTGVNTAIQGYTAITDQMQKNKLQERAEGGSTQGGSLMNMYGAGGDAGAAQDEMMLAPRNYELYQQPNPWQKIMNQPPQGAPQYNDPNMWQMARMQGMR